MALLTADHKALLRSKVHHSKYDSLVTKLLNGEGLPQELGALELMSATPFTISQILLTVSQNDGEREDARILCSGRSGQDDRKPAASEVCLGYFLGINKG